MRTLATILALACLAPTRARAERHRPVPQDEERSADRSLSTELQMEQYRVAAGDTLSGIAQRLGLPMGELLRRNPELDPDRIREGQLLRIGEAGRRVDYRIASGDTLSAIASRFEVSMAQLRRWNPRMAPNRIRAGRQLTIYTHVPESDSVSVGSPSAGKLIKGRPLPAHRGYEIRSPQRAFGTVETLNHMLHAFDRVGQRVPNVPRVRVHDISLKHGGRMRDHRSHQSGRDVDIAYYRRSCPNNLCGFARVAGKELDLKAQWELLEYWLKRGAVEAVFIDYKLQAPLYRHAKASGASKEQLRQWFQYPAGRSHPLGVIRHFPKHADHLHVRFACHESDEECKTFRPLLMRATHAAR